MLEAFPFLNTIVEYTKTDCVWPRIGGGGDNTRQDTTTHDTTRMSAELIDEMIHDNADDIQKNQIRGNTKSVCAYFKGLVEDGLNGKIRQTNNNNPLMLVLVGARITDFVEKTTTDKMVEFGKGVFDSPKIKAMMKKSGFEIDMSGIRLITIGGVEVYVMYALFMNDRLVCELQKKDKMSSKSSSKSNAPALD